MVHHSSRRIHFLLILIAVISFTATPVSAATKSSSTKTSSSTKATTAKAKTATTKTATTKKTTSSKTAKKTTTKKTASKSKKKKKVAVGKVARQVKSSIIAADRAMVLNDNNVPAVALPTVLTTQTPSTSTMVVTNPVTSDSYPITVNNPATLVNYVIPATDIRGYYAQPISGKLSQGIHDVNAVDISAPVGTVVHAAAQGVVIAVANDDGYSGGYGNYIIVSHANGTETLYAHLSYALVKAGDVVTQGQPIAFSGRTGKVTGAHLHFEVRGATNPWGTDTIGTMYSI
ncbi:MAG TPA: M23 family metallopeptidase [Candidatus Paceibacterota bacterium]|nr:M23 family metallopeptidase [Candidatus Paceibacterota bacterium]